MELIESAAGVTLREAIPRVIPVAAPAAGADIAVQNVPSGAMWIPLSITGLLTASAAVANRVPKLLFSDATTTYSMIPAFAAIVASNALQLTWGRGLGAAFSTSTAGHLLPLPLYPLPGGHQISIVTNAIQAADQWTNVAMFVIEIEQLPYDVELLRDEAVMRGILSNAIPSMREGL